MGEGRGEGRLGISYFKIKLNYLLKALILLFIKKKKKKKNLAISKNSVCKDFMDL